MLISKAVKSKKIFFLTSQIMVWYVASCEELTHRKRLWCWEGLGAGGEGDDRGWDGWMASLIQWMWVWVNSGSWTGWTGRPGVLRFMVSQRVGHDWATELNWTELNHYIYYCEQESLRRNGSNPHGQQKSLKCSPWIKSQKWQNDLCLLPRQTIQYHSNPDLYPDQ